MNGRNLIVKIAFGVSSVAVLFSLVTLVRSIIIGASVVFPIIQVVGSAAIFVICFLMFRMLLSGGIEEDEEETKPESVEEREAEDVSQEEIERAESEVDSLYEKYNLSDFEEK